MAQTTVYTCDICKGSKSKGDLAQLSIKAEGIKFKGISQYSALEIDICKECLKKKGFVVDYEKMTEQDAAKNEICLEDKIYDFLHDMGVVFEE